MNLEQFQLAHGRVDLSLDVLQSLLENNYEGEFHDFKEGCDLGDAISIANLAKDVAAFYNHMGGYIVFGVADKGFRKVGFPGAHAIDSKRLNDQFARYLSDTVRVIYAHHDLGGLRYGLVFVPKRDSVPVMMAKDGPLTNKNKHCFRKNDICLRVGDESRVISDRTQIMRLFASTVVSQSGHQSSFNYHTEPLKRLLQPDWSNFIGREAYKREVMEALSFDERAWINLATKYLWKRRSVLSRNYFPWAHVCSL